MVPVSPQYAAKLDAMMRADLDRWGEFWFKILIISTVAVVVGLLAELPEVWAEVIRPAWRWARNCWNTQFKQHDFSGWEKTCPELASLGHIELSSKWKTLVGITALLGWMLVAFGVAGEGIAEYFVNDSETNIRAFDQAVLIETQRSANSAATASSLAFTFSNKSEIASRNAVSLATGARTEADSFERDITSAKTQAADAESHLADALQRAANAEAELYRLRTPRSLIRTDELIAALKLFSGTEYTLNVFMDDESIQFTKSVAKVLDDAGWHRKQPTSLSLGIPVVEIVFGQSAERVPACLDTGISLHAHAIESLSVLQSLPVTSLPKTVQAAVALASAIGPSISPADKRNVAEGVVDPKPGQGLPLTICVGKKP